MRQSHEHHHQQGIFWPILLIVGGVILLSGNLKLIPVSGWDLLWRLWPLVLIAGGLDGLIRRDGFVGSIIVIGLGTIFLLGNLDLLSLSPWTIIVKFWPVFIIAWGLDLIVGKRTALSAISGISLGILLVIGIFYLAGYGSTIGQIGKTVPVSQRMEDIKEASIRINPIGGLLEISGGADPSQLFEGSIQHFSSETIEQNYSVSNGKGILYIRSRGTTMFFPFTGSAEQANWKIKINSTIPVEMENEVILGEGRLDLTSINIKEFHSRVVLGEQRITLPSTDNILGRANGVIGKMVILIPKDKEFVFEVDSPLASVSYPPEYIRSGDQVRPSASPSRPADSFSTIKLEQVIGSIWIGYIP